MTNDRPVYILPLFIYNAYWPYIGHLYCKTSFSKRHYEHPLITVHGNKLSLFWAKPHPQLLLFMPRT